MNIVLTPPAADPGITEDERRVIAEMMAKGTYASIMLATTDLDAVFERAQASGADVMQEPTDQPWGSRDCAFRDPAGNTVRIQELPDRPKTSASEDRSEARARTGASGSRGMSMTIADSHDLIRVTGARENNLKDVDVELPKRRLTVFTGVSGSGKSSLVFDTIAAESQRLINETYSAFVRASCPTWGDPKSTSSRG